MLAIPCSVSCGSRRGAEGAMAPPSPVKISHKKMAAKGGRIVFMFLGPPYPAAGSATARTCSRTGLHLSYMPMCPPYMSHTPPHAPLHIWYQSHNLKCICFIVQVKFTLSHSPSIKLCQFCLPRRIIKCSLLLYIAFAI